MNKFENAALATREDLFDEELSLLDLVAFVRQHSRILLGGALIGGVLGLVIAFALPAEWEANAMIRVGQFGNAWNAGVLAAQILGSEDSKILDLISDYKEEMRRTVLKKKL